MDEKLLQEVEKFARGGSYNWNLEKVGIYANYGKDGQKTISIGPKFYKVISELSPEIAQQVLRRYKEVISTSQSQKITVRELLQKVEVGEIGLDDMVKV